MLDREGLQLSIERNLTELFLPNKLTEIRFSEFGRVGRESRWNWSYHM